MIEINEIAAVLALAQLLFLGVYFLSHHQSSLARLISLYSFSLGAYILANLSFFAPNTLSVFLLFRLATLAPFVLWVIAFRLFVDNGSIHLSVWITMAFFVLTRGVGMGIASFIPGLIVNDLGYIIVLVIPQFIMLSFAIHTIYLAYQGYPADLLEQRRRLRLLFVGIMGILLVFIVGFDFINNFSRFFLEPEQILIPRLPQYLVSLYIFVMAFLFCQRIFLLSEEATKLIPEVNRNENKQKKNNNTHAPVDPSFLEKIKQTMEEDKLYSQTGLTISYLADSLSIQEYRLRRIINQQLNFRNFNQFLNNYRIEDACNRLKNTSTPISTVALCIQQSV